MRISIVTVYEPITNLGSFLQCYALKIFLEQQGHDVEIVQNISTSMVILKHLLKLNPKREFFLRFWRVYYSCKDISKLSLVNKNDWNPNDYDCVIYGSDEIWNLDNPYFRNKLFWGVDVIKPKIAYAISVGSMNYEMLCHYHPFVDSTKGFQIILPRDDMTKELLKTNDNIGKEKVCDPTMLVPLADLSFPIKLPTQKYFLIYTYGLSEEFILYIKRFAKEKGLLLVSPFFWHIWADKVIECSALQFSSLIKGAEYVFTTTFHGAVFTLLNNKRCGIFAQRLKVADVVKTFGAKQHLIDEKCSYERFCSVLELNFPKRKFDFKLQEVRNYSKNILLNTLDCIKNEKV